MPLHCTTEVVTKLLPVTVKVKEGPPPTAAVGESEVKTGTGLFIVNVKDVSDVPPPGVGLNIATEAVPGFTRLLLGTTAVTCVALTNVVDNAVPFHSTIEPLTKLVPFTVKVNVGSPAVAVVGDNDVTVGTGFGVIMASLRAPDVLPEKLLSPP